MSKYIGYLRVSTDRQDTQNQKTEILEYANNQSFRVDDWVEVEMSSRKSSKERQIDYVLSLLGEGDYLIVSELSRLGRSISQIVLLCDELIQKGINLICIKESIRINGEMDISTKIQVSMFSLMAEVERDLISERTKNGLNKAREEGKLLGRPKGSKSSILDDKKEEIRNLYNKGVNQASLARMYNTSQPSMKKFLESRGIKK